MKNNITSVSMYDNTIRLILLILIIGLCLVIMYPFASVILWSVVLALSIYPLHKKLSKKMGGKPKLASFIIIFSILVIVMLPTWLLVDSLVNEVRVLKLSYDNGTLTIPPPSPKIKQWPVIGERLYDTWVYASGNIEPFLMKYKDLLIEYGGKTAKGILNAVIGMFHIMLSLLIAGIMLAIGGTGEFVHKFFIKVGGANGNRFADMIIKTVSSVVKGILGESLVMALLNGTVFLLAGVPFAGLWAFLVFIFAVVQIPVLLITVCIALYFFAVKTTLAAIIWTIVLFIVGFSDNILTPLMLGKGAPVPMVVLFIGVIGGFFTFGFIGLFTGAILISIGYELFVGWIKSANLEERGRPAVEDPNSFSG